MTSRSSRPLRILGIAAGLALAALPFVTQGLFRQHDYYMRVVVLVGIYTILALGLNLVVGYTGQLSMGHAAFFGIGAYTSALLTLRLHWSFWVALPVSGIVAAVFGFLLGLPTLRVKGDYLAIVTLAFGEIVRLIMINWIGLTRGPMGLPGIPPPQVFGFVVRDMAVYYYMCLAMTLFVSWGVHRLVTSPLGRLMMAVREDEIPAEAMGVDVTQVKVLVFVLGGFCAGLAGSFFAHFNGYISPDNFTYAESVTILLMLVLGGIGSLRGAIIGAAVITILPEVLRWMGEWRMVLYGLLMMVLIILKPGGLLSGSPVTVKMKVSAPGSAGGGSPAS